MARAAKKEPTTDLVVADKQAIATVASVVSFRIGGRTFQAKRFPRCKICTHPGRVHIEERLLNQVPRRIIAEWVSETKHQAIDGLEVEWPPITTAQLESHLKNGHVPVDAIVGDALVEQRAEELGITYEQASERMADHVVALRQILYRGKQRLITGETDVGIKETISAAKALAAIDIATRSQVEQEDTQSFYQQAMEVYFTAAQQIMTTEQWDQFANILATNPILRSLAEQQNPNNGVVDAEVVDEK